MKTAAENQLNQFTKRPGRTLFALWLPILCSMIAEPLTGLVDTAFVASLGSDSLAALGIGTTLMSSLLGICNFLSVGTQTEVSQAMGGNRNNYAQIFAGKALLSALVLGIFIMLCCLAFRSQLTQFMGGNIEVQAQAVAYISQRSLAAPAVLLTLTCSGILYGLAQMRAPLYIAIGVNLINLILDPILIFGYGPFPELGLAGAAVASSIGQWVGCFIALFLVYKKLKPSLNSEQTEFKKLAYIAQNLLLRSGSLILFLLLTTKLANGYGSSAGAAHQAIRQVWFFTALFLDAAAVTAQTLIGYHFSNKDITIPRKVAKLVMSWSIALGILLAVIMLAGQNIFADLLVPTLSQATFFSAWHIAALSQPIASIAYVTDGIHWGTGDFRYLKNAVIAATIGSTLLLLLLEQSSWASLTMIWATITFWISLRAITGILRIWPGIGRAPLKAVK